ncbi:hypothetical protein [Burkholderia ubonensis]|uniref:hypothetical protein n=1 Tax=Burkholderia ubonensis TaxID=101571 RepID=UPI000F56A41E|nr:hypothetical protein [Burkholderia ubonensis]
MATAKDKVREINRQGATFGGSLPGAALGGAAVSTLCGPAAPVCAFVLMFYRRVTGGIWSTMCRFLFRSWWTELERELKTLGKA